jgi:hypothetical protein
MRKSPADDDVDGGRYALVTVAIPRKRLGEAVESRCLARGKYQLETCDRRYRFVTDASLDVSPQM